MSEHANPTDKLVMRIRPVSLCAIFMWAEESKDYIIFSGISKDIERGQKGQGRKERQKGMCYELRVPKGSRWDSLVAGYSSSNT